MQISRSRSGAFLFRGFVLGVIMISAVAVRAQNLFRNGSFENGPTTPGETTLASTTLPSWYSNWAEYGRSYWRFPAEGSAAVRLWLGASIGQGGLGFIEDRPHLLIFSAAGVRQGKAYEATVRVSAGSLKCDADRSFAVPTDAASPNPALFNIVRWKTYMMPFQICVSGNGSSGLSFYSEPQDEAGILIDDTYLIPLSLYGDPMGFAVFNGSEGDGNLEALRESGDGKEFLLSSTSSTGIIVVIAAPSANPPTLSLNVTVRRTTPGRVTYSASLYDFIDNVWVEPSPPFAPIFPPELSTQPGTVLKFGNWGNNLARYIGLGGVIVARVRFTTVSDRFPLDPPPAPLLWKLSIDQVAIE